jgi:predicted DNA-binding transcriptional regulator
MKQLNLTPEEWCLLFKIIMSEKPQKGSKALLKKIEKGIEEMKKEVKDEHKKDAGRKNL